MKREQEIVLLLVGNALWNRPIEALPDDVDWVRVYELAVNQLGLPAEECPLYEDSERRRAGKVLCRIFEEGNFGRHSEHKATPRPKGYAAGKLHSFYYNTSRYLRLIGVVPDFAFRYYTHYLISGIYHYFKGLR